MLQPFAAVVMPTGGLVFGSPCMSTDASGGNGTDCEWFATRGGGNSAAAWSEDMEALPCIGIL